MKYIDKIKKQHLYLGEGKNDNYFEGWYFKHVNKDNKAISFIPGISRNSSDSHSFIQVIDNINNKSHYIRFDIEDFYFNHCPFYIKIKDNIFSLDRTFVSLENPDIKADIYYDDLTYIDKSIYSPNIMGPFSYIPFMECYHGVISIRHRLHGFIELDKDKIFFNNGLGYIEKDYGSSFPNKYIWLESNSEDSSIFLSIANIPVKKMHFEGFIAILEVNNKQYRFSTYNLGKVKKIIHENNNNNIDNYFIKIEQGKYTMLINLECGDNIKLVSPKNGKMSDTILESLNSKARVTLLSKNKRIYSLDFNLVGSEINGY